MSATTGSAPALRVLANKVPQLTAAFWIVKVLATTVGETAADYLDQTLGLGLYGTCLVMSALLAASLGVQVTGRRHVPAVYWLTVVLVSVVGTLVSDLLVDDLGVSLVVTTVAFSAALVAVFTLWWRAEGTLSVHTVVTTRRELAYWSAVLVTFALGTSAGDLVAERSALGYGWSAVLFAAAIGVVALGRRSGLLGPVLAFWSAYVLTRPLGASLGDLLSQDRSAGGLGLGTTVTSAAFLLAIVGVVVHLSRTLPAPRPVAAASAAP